MNKILKLLLTLIFIIFIFSLLYYNEDIRLYSCLFFTGVAILSFLLTIIFLCKNKWRSKAKTSFAITLSCVICMLINIFVYIPKDPIEAAKKNATKFIKEYNNKNPKEHLELISIKTDSIGEYQYIAKLKKSNKSETKDIILFIDINGKANEKCYIEPSGLNDYGFSNIEKTIMKRGGYFTNNRVTDQELWAANDENRAKYNAYYEGLRSITAYQINQATNILNNGYYQRGNLIIDLTIKNTITTLENPYILVILDDDVNKTKTFQTNTTIVKGNNGYISLNLGKVNAEMFKVKILADEVFNDLWLKYYLIKKREWSGNEFRSIYVDALMAKTMLKHDRDNKELIDICNAYYYIEQFNIAQAEKVEEKVKPTPAKQEVIVQTTSAKKGTTPAKQTAATTGVIKGHEWVDLGLSVKWATCNVGANSPEEYGDYFAWGETSPKDTYTKENSKTAGKNIGDISGSPEYDAATANWGGSWRMPTEAEFRELVIKCTWTWTTQNGVKGYKVSSKKNSNSIFLPAAGCRSGSSLHRAGNDGDYWSSTPKDTYRACDLFFRSGLNYCATGYRDLGYSVRPVSN